MYLTDKYQRCCVDCQWDTTRNFLGYVYMHVISGEVWTPVVWDPATTTERTYQTTETEPADDWRNPEPDAADYAPQA